MSSLLHLASAIDRLNGWLGRSVSWLALVMVLVGAYNAVVRYLGRFAGWNLSSNFYLELQWYLFSVLFLVAAAWALREDAHVRVDVVYARLSPRARVVIDLMGHVLLLLPFCVLALWSSTPSVRASWAIREGSPDPGGLARYPLKTLILVSFGLLALQGVAELIKDAARWRGVLPPRGEAAMHSGHGAR
jgi:TRAP-type mannitol/chloroaromatic compound transport system permease small subunit